MIVGPARFPWGLAAACGALALLILWSFGVGQAPVSGGDAWRALWAALTGQPSGLAAPIDAIVLEVRAPRVLAALAVGAALSAAGAAYQGLFRNPLVSPDILGVTSGCALGAALAVILALPAIAVQSFAFLGGMAAVGLAVGIASWVRGHDPLLTLILSGVVIGSAFGAGIALAKYVADPYNQLPAITFWLMGSFSGVLPRDLTVTLVPLAIGLVPLVLLRWRIDVLALSEDEARSLGLAVGALRLVVIAGATLATASAVSLAGSIAWVGLVIPHAARLLVGSAFPRVLPLSMVLGAGFMLAVDTLCRSAFATEIPPGVVTAFVGTPMFVALMALSFRRPA